MKVVLLCAGEGTRLRPLTEHVPKPLLPIHGEPIIGHILNVLPKKITEAVLVVDKKYSTLFRHFLSSREYPFKVHLVYQNKTKKGTYYALMSARRYVCMDEKFLVINGDDIFLKTDIEKLTTRPAPCYGIYYKKSDKRYRTGDLDKRKKVITSFRFQSQKELGSKVLAFSGIYTLTKDFFLYKPIFVDGEAGIPHTLFGSLKTVHYFVLKKWIQINTHEEYKSAHKNFK